MIVLTETTDNLQVVLGGAVTTNQLRCFSVWRDVTTTAYTPGRTPTNTNNTTDVNIVAAPLASTQRVVDFVNIYNSDTVAAVVTIKFDANGTEYVLWSGSLQSGEAVQYIEGAGWTRLSNTGTPQVNTSGPIDVQSDITAGAGTWTKPTTFTPKFTQVIAYGAGGGGGGGSSQTGAVVRSGGCGGGGGAQAWRTYLTSDLSTTESFSVGTGGTAGTAGASGADGGAGGAGGNTTFSSGAKLLTAFGGGGGAFGDNAASAGAGGAGGGLAAAGGTGTTSAATGGGPGAPATPNGGCGANSLATAGSPICAEYGGGAGGGHTNVPANGLGGSSLFGGAGGGCGAGATVTPALIAATAGGGHVVTAGTGGAIGTSGAAPTAGTAGTNGSMYTGGYGGGGGGGTITANTTGGAGGKGGSHGGGGGGGGVGSNAGLGGAGGAGGDGAIYIISW